VQLLSAVIESVCDEETPLQSPLHPAKNELNPESVGRGFAVSVTL
jgi:hypothetical protein